MRTTDIALSVKRLVKFEGSGALRAFCDLAVGDLVLIKGMRVFEGKKGLFVSMPRHQGKDTKWYDVVESLTDEFKDEASRIVLEAYQREIDANL